MIVLNASGIRCDAIILRPLAVELVPLPGLTAQDIHDQVEALLSAIEAAHDIGASRGERDAAEHRMSELLEWLWDAVKARSSVISRSPGRPRRRRLAAALVVPIRPADIPAAARGRSSRHPVR